MHAAPSIRPISVLDWVNGVRVLLGLEMLHKLADPDPGNPSPGRRSALAQSLHPSVRVYPSSTYVFGLVRGDEAKDALVACGVRVSWGHPAMKGQELTKEMIYDVTFPPSIEGAEIRGLIEAAR